MFFLIQLIEKSKLPFNSSSERGWDISFGTTLSYEAKGQWFGPPAVQAFLKSEYSDFSAPYP